MKKNGFTTQQRKGGVISVSAGENKKRQEELKKNQFKTAEPDDGSGKYKTAGKGGGK